MIKSIIQQWQYINWKNNGHKKVEFRLNVMSILFNFIYESDSYVTHYFELFCKMHYVSQIVWKVFCLRFQSVGKCHENIFTRNRWCWMHIFQSYHTCLYSLYIILIVSVLSHIYWAKPISYVSKQPHTESKLYLCTSYCHL